MKLPQLRRYRPGQAHLHTTQLDPDQLGTGQPDTGQPAQRYWLSRLALPAVLTGLFGILALPAQAASANLTITKISNGGTGTFTFSGNNGFGNDSITTTAANTPKAGTTKTLTAVSATTITETPAVGYVINNVTCSGMGSGGTVTPNYGAGTFTLDAAATAAGSVIQCTVTNGAPLVADPAVKEARFMAVATIPTITQGGSGTQTLTITNNGPDSATNAVARFRPVTQTGVSVTGVSVIGGGACSFSTPDWVCPAVSSVANGSTFQLTVNYATTSASSLGAAQQAEIRVGSDEFNPSGGESLYKVWGTNQVNENRPNGAFWVGYTGTGGSAQVGPNSDEGTSLVVAWPPNQVSPTGGYLVQTGSDRRDSIYTASSTTAGPMIQQVVNTLNSSPYDSVTLPSVNFTTSPVPGDNHRAWSLRSGLTAPAGQGLQLCITNNVDDGAYFLVDGAVSGTFVNTYVAGGANSASVSLPAGYHSFEIRIVNRNTYAVNAETAAGGYGPIGVISGGSCSASAYDSLTTLGTPASIVITAAPPNVSLVKLGRNVSSSSAFVDNNGSVYAQPKQTVEYCIVYKNTGGDAPDFQLTDNVPAGMSVVLDAYAAGKGIRLSTASAAVGGTTTPAGTDITNVSDSDAGFLSATGGSNSTGLLTYTLSGMPGLAAGGSGTVCFQAKP